MDYAMNEGGPKEVHGSGARGVAKMGGEVGVGEKCKKSRK